MTLRLTILITELMSNQFCSEPMSRIENRFLDVGMVSKSHANLVHRRGRDAPLLAALMRIKI